MKITFDTSFLLECAERRRDAFGEAEELVEEKAELLVPESVFAELKSIAAGGGKKAKNAKLVLKIIEARKNLIKKIKTSAAKSDEAIRELAEKFSGEGTAVCSNDLALRKSLRKKALLICVRRAGKIGWC